MSGGLKRETKYIDDHLNLAKWKQKTTPGATSLGGFTDWILGGTVTKTNRFIAGTSTATNVYAPMDVAVPNCLSGIGTGTTANTRIGDLVEPRFMTIKGVMTASTTTDLQDPETTDNTEAGTNQGTVIERYCRTSIRVMIIRDRSMNEQGFVDFTDVFEGSGGGGENAFLWNRKIDTMGRYEILKQSEWTLDQDDPQKSFNWTIGLGGKQIRYNGASTAKYRTDMANPQTGWTVGGDPTVGHIDLGAYMNAQSMTNGIYILGVATNLSNASTEEISSPGIMFTTRIGFYDN